MFERMNDLMYRVYGEKVSCWMAGLKTLLVEMGVFSTTTSHLRYPLKPECRSQILDAISGKDGLNFREDLLPAAPSLASV